MSKRKYPAPAGKSAYDAMLLEDLETRWTSAIDLQADGLISWRNYVAIALREIAIEDVLAGLVPVIADMERLTTQRIFDGHAENPDAFVRPFGFYDWRPVWQDHFRHWQDPVRDMLGALCVTPDAKFLADQLHAVDGQVLLDFLLAPCSEACRPWFREPDKEVPLFSNSPVSMIDIRRPGRMLEQLCQVLYRRFSENAPFATMPVPDEVSLDLNYDRLRPQEEDQHRAEAGEEASPC